jgi:hypothetical protein
MRVRTSRKRPANLFPICCFPFGCGQPHGLTETIDKPETPQVLLNLTPTCAVCKEKLATATVRLHETNGAWLKPCDKS